MSSLAKAAIIFLFVIPAFSQARTGTQRAADNCEYIYATIDALADRIRRFSDGDSVLIIVAGSKRSSDRPLDIQRVTRLKEFLVDFRNAKPEQIVWGIGPASSTDFSYMRFYADGKVITELTLHPRSLLCTGEGEALPKKSRGTPRTGLTKRDE